MAKVKETRGPVVAARRAAVAVVAEVRAEVQVVDRAADRVDPAVAYSFLRERSFGWAVRRVQDPGDPGDRVDPADRADPGAGAAPAEVLRLRHRLPKLKSPNFCNEIGNSS